MLLLLLGLVARKHFRLEVFLYLIHVMGRTGFLRDRWLGAIVSILAGLDLGLVKVYNDFLLAVPRLAVVLANLCLHFRILGS